MKSKVMPQGYKNGGKAKPFGGKDNRMEEMAEAKQVRSGKISPAQYKAKEMAEARSEGSHSSPKKLMSTGKSLASGKMSAAQYANAAPMKDGGYVCGMRSRQDYGK
jgi:hypothetical protein